VRARATRRDAFAPLSGAATCRLQGIHLVRVPTLEPILRRDYFLKRIASCERERAARFSTAAQKEALLGGA
jgi:hypothetical protein